LELRRSVEDIAEDFADVLPQLMPYRDAANTETWEFDLGMRDCLAAIEKAVEFRWFNYSRFDI
jgi:hypothetical protein